MVIKDLLHPIIVVAKSSIDNIRHYIYLSKSYNTNIQKLRYTQEGKRCFIIGNGPSLSISDLNKLKDEDCFASNRIYGLFPKTDWRPKYYCSQDEKVLEQISTDLKVAVNNCTAAFFPYNYKKLLPSDILGDTKVHMFYKPYVSVYSKDGKYQEGIMPFSNDISKAVYDGLSITFGMIQIAVYLGYKEIYLVGIDHNYAFKNGIVDSSKSYCEGIKPIDMSTQYPPELELCENAFRTARKFCEAHNILIKNATRGGKLEVFERISLDKLVD